MEEWLPFLWWHDFDNKKKEHEMSAASLMAGLTTDGEYGE